MSSTTTGRCHSGLLKINRNKPVAFNWSRTSICRTEGTLMKIRTVPNVLSQMATLYQGRILLLIPCCYFLFVCVCFVLVCFLFRSMSPNLSQSDVDSNLGTQRQDHQDVGIAGNSDIFIFCYKNHSFIQQIFLNSYYHVRWWRRLRLTFDITLAANQLGDFGPDFPPSWA